MARKKKGDESTTEKHDGLTFIVPSGEVGMHLHSGALITFHRTIHYYSAVWPGKGHHRHHDRKSYSTIGRIKRWVEGIEEASGGTAYLDPEQGELLTVASFEQTPKQYNRHRGEGEWKFGRILQHNIRLNYRGGALYTVDDGKTEGRGYRDSVYLCDSVEVVAELNEAHEAVQDAEAKLSAVKARHLRKLPSTQTRPGIVKLAKMQQRRVKTKAARRAKARR